MNWKNGHVRFFRFRRNGELPRMDDLSISFKWCLHIVVCLFLRSILCLFLHKFKMKAKQARVTVVFLFVQLS